jgi:hypothetical protein
MGTNVRTKTTHQTRWAIRSRTLVLGATCAAVLIGAPSVAMAATSPGTQSGQSSSNTMEALTSSICSKVSAASVSAIIGYKVPAPTSDTFAIKPTKTNYEISGTNTTCTYGPETSMASIVKAVTLTYEVISKPLTTAEMQASIKKASASAHFKFAPYSGLGVAAFYFSLTESGITGQGITGVADGTHYFGADVETAKVSKATLAALAKLAAKL